MKSKVTIYLLFTLRFIEHIIGCSQEPSPPEFNPTTPRDSGSYRILQLFQDYDSLIRPHFYGDKVTEVICDIFVNSIDSISIDTMDYSVDMYMRQTWEDPRLAFSHIYPNVTKLTLDNKFFNYIWVPDLFFANEKQAQPHGVTVPNRLIRLYANGTILYSARYTLKLTCPMSLKAFPLDTQKCHLVLESYGYTVEEMRFVWRNDALPIHTNSELQFPQFDLTEYDVTKCQKSYITGNFTCLKATFYLQRQYGYYMIQNYIPSGLIVVLSWVSFWINIDAVPARISLGVLTVLTMTTLCVGLWMSLPSVSYVKAIDIWMSTCVLFVFMAMVEFALVNTLARSEIKQMSRNEKDSGQQDGKLNTEKIKTMVDEDTNGLRKKLDPSKRIMAHTIDKISRVIFPLIFVLFNVGYWCMFLYR